MLANFQRTISNICNMRSCTVVVLKELLQGTISNIRNMRSCVALVCIKYLATALPRVMECIIYLFSVSVPTCGSMEDVSTLRTLCGLWVTTLCGLTAVGIS